MPRAGAAAGEQASPSVQDGRRAVDPKLAAAYRISAALRRTNDLLKAATAPLDVLDRVAEACEAAADELAAASEHPEQITDWAQHSRLYPHHSPVTGRANAGAPVLKASLSDGKFVMEGVFRRSHEGGPGTVSGGVIAGVLDDVLGRVQYLTGLEGSAVTGSITVRFVRPAPLYRHLRFTGWIDRHEGRKRFSIATCTDGETLIAEAEAIFIERRQPDV